MAGRGRGRGKASLSFDIGSLGFGRGENIPSATLQPPPLFPPLEFRPSPLSNTEVDNYLLVLKQELRGAIRESPYFLKTKIVKKDINRYSDRYKSNQNEDKNWEPDWKFFPKELKPTTSKRKAGGLIGIAPTIKKRKVTSVTVKEEDIKEKLETLEKKLPEKEDAENDDDNEENEEELEIDDEDEDDNDYNFDYYDDGGDAYGQGDDEGDDGPVY